MATPDVDLTDGQVFERTAVFVRPGNLPHDNGLLTGLGCEHNEAGLPIVDATGRTSTRRPPGRRAMSLIPVPR